MDGIQGSISKLNDDQIVQTMMFMIDRIERRLLWDEYFCMLAMVAKQRSSCERLKVGCVVVKNNTVLSTGYNGHVAGAPHTSKVVDGHEQMTIHAETNAVCSAARNGVSIEGAKLYVTHFPCVNCAKVLLGSGVTEIIYINDYKNSDIVYELFRSKGVRINKMDFPILRELQDSFIE